MEEYTLERTGDRPIKFNGELIAYASTNYGQGPCQRRWWQLALYQTDSGKFAMHINYHTDWHGEFDKSEVFVEDTIESVVEQLKCTIPVPSMTGFPVGSQYAEKQARVLDILTSAWNVAVSVIFWRTCRKQSDLAGQQRPFLECTGKGLPL